MVSLVVFAIFINIVSGIMEGFTNLLAKASNVWQPKFENLNLMWSNDSLALSKLLQYFILLSIVSQCL